MRAALPVLVIATALSGCGVGTVVKVATAPVRAASKAVDLATTSQSERDENRGRELRHLEERYGKLDREYGKQDKRCGEGVADACTRRDAIATEMDAIRPQLPAQP
jgi:hypothetical protein